MIAQEIINETHVYSSIKHAEIDALKKNGKVILSVGGYFKVVDKNVDGIEVESRPGLNQERQQKQQEIDQLTQQNDALRKELSKKNIPWYHKAWRPWERADKHLTKLRKELNYLKTAKATYQIKNQNDNTN